MTDAVILMAPVVHLMNSGAAYLPTLLLTLTMPPPNKTQRNTGRLVRTRKIRSQKPPDPPKFQNLIRNTRKRTDIRTPGKTDSFAIPTLQVRYMVHILQIATVNKEK